MQGLPEGTVTVLFSDIEGSTGLVSSLGAHWGQALSAQRAKLREVWAAHGGHEMGTEGDSFFVVFGSARDAVLAAIDGQRAIHAHPWPGGVDVRVRMGLHTGEPERHEEGYIGLDVHRGARIAGTAHGGQVVLSESTRQMVGDLLAADRGITARDLGWHRLKDLIAPLHLFDLVVDDLPATFPPLRSLGSEAGLPRPAATLVGRDAEVAALQELLRRADVRLVTVTGTGGTGKTRVALAAATGMAGSLPGVFFVSLGGTRDAQAMWAGIGEAVGAGGSRSSTPHEQVLEVLAYQPGLLVLDNLEQIADADQVVAALLDGCPDLLVLTTSRAPLHLMAEHIVPLAPMALPPTGAHVAAAQASEAVRLFADRARMVRPSFEVTADNVDDVVAVCRRLDGLPLALELAAARLRLLSPRALLARLDDSLSTASTHGDRPERHRTLRNTIAWSHDLLGPDDRVVFRRLAAFVGGAGMDALEAVCAFGDVDPLDSVGRLVDASLVRVRERPDGEPHLWMLETVRAFARDQLLASDEADEVLDRHLAWCVELVAGLNRQLHGPAPLTAVDAIDAALPDIRMALDRAVDTDPPQRHAAAAQLMSGMNGYWYRYRSADEWRWWNDRLREATGDVDSEALVQSLHGAALKQLMEGNPDKGAELLERAVAATRRLGDRALEARALNSLGVAFLDAGDRPGARRNLEASLAIARDIPAPDREATVLTNLAVLCMLDGEPLTGLEHVQRAMEIDRASGDAWSLTVNEINMAATLVHVRGAAAALSHLNQVAGHVPDAGDSDLMADLLDQYIYVCAHLGAHQRAAELCGAAHALRESVDLPRQPFEGWLVDEAVELGRDALGSQDWGERVAAGRGLDLAAALQVAAAALEADAASG